jgi:hypothetical protein
VTGRLDFYLEKGKMRFLFYIIYKVGSREIKELNIKKLSNLRKMPL